MLSIVNWLLAITGSRIFRAFSITAVGICWIMQIKHIEAGYPPEWDWIIFLVLGTIWELQEWYRLCARKNRES